MRLVRIGIALLTFALPAAAQDAALEVGAQVALARAGALDSTDTGFGARVAWRSSGMFGVEGEFNFYPADLPERVPFSGSRTEALFGITAGPKLGTIRPFARVRPGLLRYAEAPAPIACILIFPPPLSCQLAAGQTLFALDLGGGVEIDVSPRSYVRIDAGDRIVKYPEPAIENVGNEFRAAIGLGLRF